MYKDYTKKLQKNKENLKYIYDKYEETLRKI